MIEKTGKEQAKVLLALTARMMEWTKNGNLSWSIRKGLGYSDHWTRDDLERLVHGLDCDTFRGLLVLSISNGKGIIGWNPDFEG